MLVITPYLTFNGNCREAMTFYCDCLGGELLLETIGDSPLADNMPLTVKSLILQATLTKAELLIVASDMVQDKGLVKGNAISMMIRCGSEYELRDFYKRLSRGGEATHPPQNSYWGSLSADLMDKFGNQWLLYFDRDTTF